MSQKEILKSISVVVPLYNEEENLTLLYDQLKKTLDMIEKSYEIIFVDDGSKDGTYEKLNKIYQYDHCVKIVKLSKNFGQTAALVGGMKFSKGEVIITMDGDLQHNPKDIPKFLKKIDQGCDLVCGWRKKRTDNLFTRRVPSTIANKMLRCLFKTDLHDFGSNYRAYSRKAIKSIRPYSQMHRFIPALVNKKDISVCEVPISNTKRIFGKSKYGLSRVIYFLFDLLIVKIFSNLSSRQLQILRIIGIFFFILGFFFVLNIARQFLYLFIASVLLVFLGFAILLCLSFYAGVKYKPLYHVEEIKFR